MKNATSTIFVVFILEQNLLQFFSIYYSIDFGWAANLTYFDQPNECIFSCHYQIYLLQLLFPFHAVNKNHTDDTFVSSQCRYFEIPYELCTFLRLHIEFLLCYRLEIGETNIQVVLVNVTKPKSHGWYKAE